MTAVIKLNHVAISVSDLDRSIAFYTDELGLRVVATQPAIEALDGFTSVVGYEDEEVHGRWALLAAGDDRVELVAYSSPLGQKLTDLRRAADLGPAHVAFEVDDVDALCTQLIDHDIRIISRPITLGRHRTFYAYGPDGELLELLEQYSAIPPGAVEN